MSVQQPWAFAIARGGKTVSNQDLPTAYRGPLLIHASMRVDLKACDSPLIQAAGWDPRDPLATIGAVIAVADLDHVCSTGDASCDCGPWSAPGSQHWHLSGVRALPRPIVTVGHPGLWQPKPSLISAVTTMFTTTAALNNTT
ncbi:hypothetical protein [Actinomadura sp. KC345]|uniref:hypothetical protein n=1 Tax=Actinomadura sp. KC345 TaxID=2530371 RepID=UPI001FB7854A|nr:hypothetical protein [Actinomadura sp. KC345]